MTTLTGSLKFAGGKEDGGMNASLEMAAATHNLIIADRSDAGVFAVATILDVCPLAKEGISAWHDSTERFILFILEQKDNRIGSVTARDLHHLLETVLPELYLDLMKPPANIAFDILVDSPDLELIDDRIAQLLISAALEEGLLR